MGSFKVSERAFCISAHTTCHNHLDYCNFMVNWLFIDNSKDYKEKNTSSVKYFLNLLPRNILQFATMTRLFPNVHLTIFPALVRPVQRRI